MLAENYSLLLTIHGAWRWVVLLAAGGSLAWAVAGWARGLPFAPWGDRARSCCVAAVDIQLLLGLPLYAASPIVRSAWMNLSLAMKQPEPRFFSVKHSVTMLLAVALAHVGAVRVRAAADDRRKFSRLLLWNGLSLLAILIGIPWWRPLLRGWMDL